MIRAKLKTDLLECLPALTALFQVACMGKRYDYQDYYLDQNLAQESFLDREIQTRSNSNLEMHVECFR